MICQTFAHHWATSVVVGMTWRCFHGDLGDGHRYLPKAETGTGYDIKCHRNNATVVHARWENVLWDLVLFNFHGDLCEIFRRPWQFPGTRNGEGGGPGFQVHGDRWARAAANLNGLSHKSSMRYLILCLDST